MSDHTRKNKIDHDCIQEDISMTLIEDTKTKSIKVIWTCAKKATKGFGEEVYCRVFSFVKTKTGRERLKGTLEEIIKSDLSK